MRIQGVVVGALLLGAACGGPSEEGVRPGAGKEEGLGTPTAVTPTEPRPEQSVRCADLLSYPEALPVAPPLQAAPEAEACGDTTPTFASRGTSEVTAPFGFTEAPACIPTKPEGTRFAHACRQDQFTGCGQWLHTEFFDAEGRLTRAVTPEGDGVVETRRTYEGGQPVREETLGATGYRLTLARFTPDGNELSWRERWRNRAGDHCTETTRDTTLNEWGAPAFTLYDGEHRMTYAYDDQRRLLGVDGHFGTRSLRYAPEGYLAWEKDLGWYHNTEKTFDAQGRPTQVAQGGMGGSGVEDLTYGPYGLTARSYQWDGGSRGTTRTEVAYDDAGRAVLEWQSTDGELHVGGGYVETAHERIAVRRTFSCEGDLLLEEVDRNLDGLADARTEYERDPAGNLLSRSTFEGKRRTGFTRYEYSCAAP